MPCPAPPRPALRPSEVVLTPFWPETGPRLAQVPALFKAVQGWLDEGSLSPHPCPGMVLSQQSSG